MPKKSSADDLIARFNDGEIENSMILMSTTDGERMYLHQFDDDLHALEYLELMVASFRVDVLEKIMKRSMN